MNGYTNLHIFTSATMKSEIYKYVVLYPYIKLFRGEIGNNSLLMDDKAIPQRTEIATDYLGGDKIQRMECIGYLMDLNSMEHVWNALGSAYLHH